MPGADTDQGLPLGRVAPCACPKRKPLPSVASWEGDRSVVSRHCCLKAFAETSPQWHTRVNGALSLAWFTRGSFRPSPDLLHARDRALWDLAGFLSLACDIQDNHGAVLGGFRTHPDVS